MNKFLLTLCLAGLLASCTSQNPPKEGKTDAAETPPAPRDTTPKVTGVGGVFFYAENPKEVKDWYAKNLGVEINDWGSASFESRNIDRPDEINSLQWKPFKKGDTYFAPSKKEFMINYQVQNLEGLVRQLRANGVTILDTVAVYDYGKFVNIMDLEGNKLELWEPAEETAE